MTQRCVETVSPPPRPCGLPYHKPGQRVTWVEGLTRRFGVVVLHNNRSMVLRPSHGEDVYTSCGHVVGVK